MSSEKEISEKPTADTTTTIGDSTTKNVEVDTKSESTNGEEEDLDDLDDLLDDFADDVLSKPQELLLFQTISNNQQQITHPTLLNQLIHLTLISNNQLVN